MSGNLYYVIYFVGGKEQALADWFSGKNTINKTGPFSNKLEAIIKYVYIQTKAMSLKQSLI